MKPIKYTAIATGILLFCLQLYGNPLSQAESIIASYPDSALKIINEYFKESRNKEDQFKRLTLEAAIFLNMGQIDSAQAKLQMAWEFSQKSSSLPLQARFYEVKGAWHHSRRDEFDSKKETLKAIDSYKALKDTSGLARSHRQYGDILFSYNDIKGGLEHLKIAAEFADVSGNLITQAKIYNDLGTELCTNGRHLEAIPVYRKALMINQSQKQFAALAGNLINIGVSYFRLGQSDSALYYYQKAYTLADSLKLYRNMAQSLMNAGNAYKNMNLPDSARQYYLRSRDISRMHGIFIGELYNIIALINLENLQGNYMSAISLGEDALKLVDNRELPYEKMKLYANLRKSYEKSGELDKAITYYKLHEELFDSLNSAEKNKQVLEMKSRYESERQAREILELRQAREEEKHNLRLMLFAGIIIVIISSALFIILIQRNRLARLELNAAKQAIVIASDKLSRQEEHLLEKSQHISQLSALAQNLKQHLSKIQKDTDETKRTEAINQLMNVLNLKQNEFNWLKFESNFESVHPGFIKKLKEIQSNLSPIELQIALLIRVGLSTKEIAFLLNKSIRTIEDVRLRLRKKLSINDNGNLLVFLKTL